MAGLGTGVAKLLGPKDTFANRSNCCGCYTHTHKHTATRHTLQAIGYNITYILKELICNTHRPPDSPHKINSNGILSHCFPVDPANFPNDSLMSHTNYACQFLHFRIAGEIRGNHVGSRFLIYIDFCLQEESLRITCPFYRLFNTFFTRG